MTAAADGVDSSKVAVAGFLGTLAVFVAILGLTVLFFQESSAERRAKERAPVAWRQLSAEQQSALATYRWIDRDKGIVGVPIDRAMSLVVREMQEGQ